MSGLIVYRKGYRRIASDAFIYILLIAGSMGLLLPFFWMISASLKPASQIFKTPVVWLPNPPRWDNYLETFNMVPFLSYIFNTLKIAAGCILGDLVSCSLAAYSFARLRFPGKNIVFFMLLSTMMVPSTVTMIPTFIIFKNLGWIDTFKPIILPSWLGYPLWIFLLRQYFMTIPFELDDSARIDGCGYLRTYWSILVPQIKPALMAVGIFSFMASWNDFFRALIYINSEEKFNLGLALRMFQGMYSTSWELVMSASVIACIPPLIIYFFAQKYFLQGIVVSGVKG